MVTRLVLAMRRWVDSYAQDPRLAVTDKDRDKIDWFRVLPFVLLHMAALTVIWVGWSWVAVWTAVGLYALRVFSVTAFYHRNNFVMALLTFGEGWHNNHHHYPVAVRQGFYWWEVDIAYYILKVLSWTGLVWDLHPVPVRIRSKDLLDRGREGESA